MRNASDRVLTKNGKKYPKLAAVLKRLLFERDIKAVDLARAVNLPPPTIHRLITGKSTRPYESSLQPIADYFSIKMEQLLGEKPLPLDDNFQHLNHSSQDLKKSGIVQVPLVPWNDLDHDTKKESDNKIPFIGSISANGFATIMPDTSMEPIIQRNAMIIFDPSVNPTDRSYVLVKLHETNAYVLRQLLVDADHHYLKPLHPDLKAFKMRLLHKNDEIIGCLVETRHHFQTEMPTNNAKEFST